MEKNRLAIAFVLQLLCSPSIFAGDWDSCADELYELRQTVSDAEDAVSDVESKAEYYEQCKLLPITDLWNDGCRSTASGYEYQLSNLQGELERVNKLVRSVKSSCTMPASALTSSTTAPRTRDRR